jgi:hypothetical protein
MHELLHHTLAVLLALPTWVAPLLFLPIARRQLASNGSRRLWRVWLGAVALFALFAVAAWYVLPERTGNALAVLAAELILVGPALAATALVLQETRGTSLTERHQVVIAGVIGMAVLLLCFLPAAGVSAALGGSGIGSGC